MSEVHVIENYSDDEVEDTEQEPHVEGDEEPNHHATDLEYSGLESLVDALEAWDQIGELSYNVGAFVFLHHRNTIRKRVRSEYERGKDNSNPTAKELQTETDVDIHQKCPKRARLSCCCSENVDNGGKEVNLPTSASKELSEKMKQVSRIAVLLHQFSKVHKSLRSEINSVLTDAACKSSDDL